MDKEKIYVGTYKVVKLFRSKGMRIVASTGLCLEDAEAMAIMLSNETQTKYVTSKEFQTAKYYRDSKV
jgi:3-hydroxyisobutyrate dehydrogenase-like beta-hydroxyacid dehydrogenase